MPPVSNAEAAADLISTTPAVADNAQLQTQAVVPNKPQLKPRSGDLPSDTREIVNLPHNIPERVVYVSQSSPHFDTRVTNVMQGRESHVTEDIPKGQFQNKVLERVVCVTQKTLEDEARNLNEKQGDDTSMTNTMSERIVHVQRNVPEDNISLPYTTEMVPHGLNSMQERIIYVPHTPHSQGNVNVADNTTNLATDDCSQLPVRVVYVPCNVPDGTVNGSTNDRNDMPVRVVYVPHNVPGGNENMQNIPGVIVHAPNKQGEILFTPNNIRTPSPNNMQGQFQNESYNMPSRTPSPNTTQQRTLKVAEQVVKMAYNMSKQNHDETKRSQNFVYAAQPMAQPAMYSPYMMGGGSGFMPQMYEPMGYMPQMQSQMPQQMFQQQAHMPIMNQPVSFIPPSPQPVQDGLYMNSTPSFENGEDFSASQPVLPDIQDTDIVDDDCSWLECCCCFLSGNDD